MAEFILIDEHANKYGDSKKAIPLFIAPLTAFAGPSPPATAAHKSGLQAAAAFSLPLSWDIRNQGTVTGKGQKGRAFHPIVRNQLQCGSCWAHAIAEVASDFLSLYAESEKDDQVSVTSVILNSGDPLGDEGSNVLSKMFPRGTGGNAFNNGCCGGDCRAAVIFLSSTQYPLAFESCNDYTWMRRTCGGKTPVGPNKKTLKPSSSTCTSPMTNYFNQAAADFLTGNVEGGIPLDGKNGRQACYYDNSKHSLVRIQGPLIYSQGSVTVLVESEANPSHFNPNSKSNSSTSVEASQNQQLIKKHLYTTGSVAVMFAVLNDFVTGGGPNQKNVAGPSAFTGKSSWKKMTNGKYVYIENRSQAKLAGAHAVVVMGWGVSKVDSNTTPYWIVRNSWGPGWNDQGYFNIAMYPINIMCQFSREWNRFSPTMLPSGTLGGLPNGRGYSGVFVSFKTVVTPASAVPVLPSWDKMTAEKLKNELDVSCDNNVLNGESPSSWIAFHQTDTHKPFGKPTTATKSTTTKTGEGILSFFEKHVVITIIVIIMIVAGLGFLLF